MVKRKKKRYIYHFSWEFRLNLYGEKRKKVYTARNSHIIWDFSCKFVKRNYKKEKDFLLPFSLRILIDR